MAGDPVVEEVFQLRVQGNVAVVVQLPDRDAKPVGRPDLHHGVDGECEQLAASDAGAGQQLDDQSRQRVRVSAGSPLQFRCGGVVEEPWQRLVGDGQVTDEDQRPGGGVVVAPVGDPVEEAVQVDQRVFDADPVQGLAGATGRLGQQVLLERFDVGPVEVGAAGDLGMGGGQPEAEDAEVVLDVFDRVRPQADLDLVEVAAGGCGEQGRCCRPAGDRHRLWSVRPGESAEVAGVEQGQLETVEHRREVAPGRGHPAIPVGLQQRRPHRDELRVPDLFGWDAADRGDLGEDIPLRCGVDVAGAKVGGEAGEPAVLGRPEQPGGVPQMQVQLADQARWGLEAAGHHQPGSE